MWGKKEVGTQIIDLRALKLVGVKDGRTKQSQQSTYFQILTTNNFLIP